MVDSDRGQSWRVDGLSLKTKATGLMVLSNIWSFSLTYCCGGRERDIIEGVRRNYVKPALAVDVTTVSINLMDTVVT